MINGAYYAGKLRLLRQEIARKRWGKLTQGVLFLHDNDPAHTSQVVMTAVTECGFGIVPRPPYFPDMAPSDFYMFPKLKFHLLGTQYGSNECVIEAVNEYLGDQEGIRKLKWRWAKCKAPRSVFIIPCMGR